ncbi:hypothetical protein J3459_009827 [Metarhizium acridum]|nr:hypothetical protein J3459_009827 [Metarhizium acridum]
MLLQMLSVGTGDPNSLPGTYRMKKSTYKSRVTIVSALQALFISDQQPLKPTRVVFIPPAPNQALNFMGSCALPYYDTQTGKVEDVVSCAGCQLAVEKGIIGVSLDSWSWAREVCTKVYARDEFLEHFRWCKQAQLLWNTSDEGKSQPPELPVAARLNGHFGQEVNKDM